MIVINSDNRSINQHGLMTHKHNNIIVHNILQKIIKLFF